MNPSEPGCLLRLPSLLPVWRSSRRRRTRNPHHPPIRFRRHSRPLFPQPRWKSVRNFALAELAFLKSLASFAASPLRLMKIRFATFSLLGALMFFTACESVNSRIKEKPAAFAQADAAAQDKIKQGIIDIGFSEDLVYLALGKPDQKR